MARLLGATILTDRPWQFTRKLIEPLKEAGSSLKDVVRVRTYVTDISRWEEVAKAQGEVFAEIRPAATLVQVSALVEKDLLVEIEVDAMA